MDHLLHPWHYVPLIMALPFLGAIYAYMKQKLYGDPDVRDEDEEEAESDRRMDG
jgi:hypothetical protein